MQTHEEAVREIVCGLEGLEMLSQWQLSLARDLQMKAEAVLKSAQEKERPADDSPKGE